MLATALGLAMVAAACGSAGTVSEARGDGSVTAPDPAAAADLRQPSADLAAGLLRTVSAERDGNVAVSPLLVLDGLAMVRTGSAGSSRAELDAVLGTSALDDQELLAAVAGLQAAVEASTGEQRNERRRGEVAVDLPSSVWAQRGTTVGDPWLDGLATSLDRPVRLVDFRSDPDTARDALNRWALDATGGGITQLVPRGQITSTTRLVVAGASWYEAPWAVPFDPASTTDEPFEVPDGGEAQVPTLHGEAPSGLRHAEGDGWEAVGVPYLGDDLELVVILPTTGSLSELTGSLTGDDLLTVLDELRPTALRVTIPRFSFTSELDLVGPLRALGLGDVLDVDAADLEALAPSEPLALDEVVQQTFVSVDEEGTRQSAATVEEEPTPAPPDAEAVTVDRPFAFALVHRPTDGIVLIGQVTDPRR